MNEQHTLLLNKEDDCYIFVWDAANRGEMLRTLGRFAGDPNLSFTWYDAAVLSQRVRQQKEEETRLADDRFSRFKLRNLRS